MASAGDRAQARPRPGVLAREIGGEMVILDIEAGVYYGLDEVGTRAWTLLAEGVTLGAVEDRLLAEYEVDAEILRADLDRLLADLAERGLIDVTPE